MTINVQLLEETMGRILAEPENWNQEHWVTNNSKNLPEDNTCGTTMCFAGHAVVLSGARMMMDFANTCTTADGCLRYIPRYASEVLGLTNFQADQLFSMSNSLDDLQRIVKAFVEQAGSE